MPSMKRGFWVMLIALLVKVGCQYNEKLSSDGSNPDKGCERGQFSNTNSRLLIDRIPLNKGDVAVDSKNKKLHSKRKNEEDFTKSFLFISTMFYSL